MDERAKKIILMVLVVLVIYMPFLEANGWDLINKQAWDFPSFYYAAETVYELELTPYSQENWAVAQTLYDGTLYAFLYLPPSLPMFRLLNFMGFETAKLFMLVLNHLMTLLLIWLVFKKIFKAKTLDWFFLFGAVYVLNFSPLMATLRLGQVNLLVMNALLLAWIALKERWHAAAVGIPIAFATILKFNPAIFFVYLFLKKQYKALVWGVGGLAAATVLSYFFLPEGIWIDWIENVLSPGFGEVIRGQDPAATALQGVNGFAARSFLGREDRIAPLIYSPLLAKMVPYILSILLTLPILYLAFRNDADKQSGQTWDVEFALYLTVMFLVSPLAWDNHLVFMLPPIFVTVKLLIDHWPALRGKWVWSVLLIGSIVAISYAFPYNLPFFRSGLRPLLVSNKFYGVMLIWLFLVLQAWRGIGTKKGATASE